MMIPIDSIRVAIPLLVALSLSTFACGGKSTEAVGANGADASSATKGDAASSASIAGCSWPASLDPPADAGPWSWTVARYDLTCKDGSDFEGCLSNDPNGCPGVNAIPGATVSDCVDQCGSNEYAFASGGPPDPQPDGGFSFPPSPPALPASCHSIGANPAGVTYSCCACE